MSKTQKITLTGLFTALTTLLTWSTSFLTLPSGGYFNPGDVVIFITASLMGIVPAVVVGGVGSAIADMLSAGGMVFAPFTLVVKGLEGLVCALLIKAIKNPKLYKNFIAYLISAFVMVIGYMFTYAILYGWGAILVNTPFDLIQALVCASLATAIIIPIKKLFERSYPLFEANEAPQPKS